MERHQNVIHSYPTSWRSVRTGDLTPDRSDADGARGTLRSPLILQPLDLKEAGTDNNSQKLSPF